MTKKNILFLHRSHPNDIRAREALDAAVVAAVFEQTVTILFRDDGIFQLCAGGSSQSQREFAASIESLSEYGISALFVCRESLRRHGIGVSDLLVPVQEIDSTEQALLIAKQQAVVND